MAEGTEKMMVKFNVNRFDGKDFMLWKIRVENALKTNQCWNATEEGFKADDEDNEEKDEKAKLIIMSSITDKILRKIHKPTAKEMWEALIKKYEEKDVQGLNFSRKKFFNSKQGTSESVEEFIDRVINSREELEIAGLTISETDVILTIIQGIQSSFENFVQCLTVNKKVNDLDLDEIVDALVSEEKRRSELKDPNQDKYNDHAFYAKNKNFNYKRNNKGLKCFNSSKFGHIAKYCRLPKKDDKLNNNNNRKFETLNAVTEKRKDFVFNTSENNFDSRNVWLLDSGASNHSCCNEEFFSSMNSYNSVIKVGRELQVKGIGTIDLKVKFQNRIINIKINETLYVPDLSVNLISIGKLSKKGYSVFFEKDSCKIIHENEIVAECFSWKANSNLYELKVIKENEIFLTSENYDPWKLWHHRLGHLSPENMKKIRAEDLEFNKNRTNSDFCETCTLGKQTKMPHNSVEKFERNPNYIVIHSDIVGPMQTLSIGLKKYVLTYLCGFTEYSFVYLLKNKSEQFETFKEFKNPYESMTGKRINELRSDNGREYLSNEFQNYLKENGIKHNTSVEYCPQSNGKAERLNRTLIEKARCLLISENLNLNLWGAAITTANYLRNRSPSAPLGGKSPYEAFFNKMPKLNHLRIFGCKAYPLELNGNRNKFDPVSKKDCILIGYGEKEGNYKIFDKNTQKAFRSRDVKFNEDFKEKQDSIEIDISLKNDKIEKEKTEVFEEKDKEEEKEVKNEDVVEHKVEQSNIESKEKITEKDIQTEEDLNLPRRSSRVPKPVQKYVPGEAWTKKEGNDKIVNFVQNEIINEEEPNSIQEALSSRFKEKWREAIQSELDSHKENNTWTPVNLPPGRKTIKTKWIFKIKRTSNNEPGRFKARLVAKGYEQTEGIDYNETFAPVFKQQSLRLLLALAINENLSIHQIDISTAFLYGELDEEIYIDPPDGLEGINENQVLKLNKALYGLKQGPRSWNKTLVNFFNEINLKKLETDNAIFVNQFFRIAVYVDDIVIFGKEISKIEEFKQQIGNRFKIKDLGKISFLLGIQIEQLNKNTLILNQKGYIDKMIKQFDLQNCKDSEIPIQPNHKLTSQLLEEKESLRQFVDPTQYRKMIGSLIYLMTCTRPDISYSVGILSRYMQEPREFHLRFLKRLLKYVNSQETSV